MKSIRLLPVVLVAASALFVLKGIGLVTQGGYLLVGSSPAKAQAQPVADPAIEQGGVELSASEAAAAARAAEALFADDRGGNQGAAEPLGNDVPVATQSEQETQEPDGVSQENPASEPGAQEAELPEGDSFSATERAVLQRLRERRIALDTREREVELRMALVEAAEARLNERIASLEQLESRVQALVDQRNAQGDEQFLALVSMYENMKSADAAAVFNTLNMEVLLRLAINMNPRKMSPIMADMQTERAQELTVRMATARTEPDQIELASNTGEQDNSDLPQIVGQ
ncbi:MAG TPA: hypothetical protein ENJ90_08100 [Devosia sp.]|nr:hypothetical protein [Devosia sp.]